MNLKTRDWQFTDDRREFVIRRRDLPDPWKNILAVDAMQSVIDQTEAGLSFGRSASDDCFTAEDSPRMVYVRDNATGRHWTVNGAESHGTPSEWPRIWAVRPCRDPVYHVRIEDPRGVGRAVEHVELDGRSVEGDVIPAPGRGGRHDVRVALGE